MAKAKYPLAWHEENIANSERYAKELEQQADQLMERVVQIRARNNLIRERLEQARKDGVSEFPA